MEAGAGASRVVFIRVPAGPSPRASRSLLLPQNETLHGAVTVLSCCYWMSLKRLCSPIAPCTLVPPSRPWASVPRCVGKRGPQSRGGWAGAPGTSAPSGPRRSRPARRPSAPLRPPAPCAPAARPRCYSDGGPPCPSGARVSAPSPLSARSRDPPSPTLGRRPRRPLVEVAGRPFPLGAKSSAHLPLVRNQRRRRGFQPVGERRALPGIGAHVPRRSRGRFRGPGRGCTPQRASRGLAGACARRAEPGSGAAARRRERAQGPGTRPGWRRRRR